MTAAEQCPMRTGVLTETAPVGTDRTAGWRFYRDNGPVFEDSSGVYHCTDRDGVRFMMQHPELFSSYLGYQGLHAAPDNPPVPLAIDPPEHRKFRQVLDRMFSPRALRPLEEDLRLQVAELVGRFAGRGRCDAIADLARLYPTQVFLTLFGLPAGDRDLIAEWVHLMNANIQLTSDGGAPPEVQEASAALTEYLRGFVEEKRRNPGEDIFSDVLAITGDAAWTDAEILGFAFLFTNAGIDTVTATTGFVMEHLATKPELRRTLVADPELIRPTVEELLRLEPVIPTVPRMTTQEVELCGYTIPAGKTVLPAFAAINRDPDLYPVPESIDLTQADRGHLTFGSGVHRCIGSHLARLELRLMIEEFHRAIPEYEIEPGFVPRMKWPAGVVSYDRLPLVWST